MATRRITIGPVLETALKRHEAGDLDAAEKGYRQTLMLTPGHPVATLYLGVLHHDRRDYAEAERLIAQSIASNPREPAAHNHLALTLLALRREEEAIESFRRAIRLKPGYLDALNNLATTLKRLKRDEEAITVFNEVIRIAPDYPYGHYNLGLLHHARQRVDEAEACFRRTLEVAPGFYKARHQMGLVAETRGDFEEAARCYEAVLAAEPRFAPALTALLALRSYQPSPELIARGEAMARSGKLFPPDSFTSCYALAKRFDKAGDYDRAFDYLKLANGRRSEGRTYDRAKVEARFDGYVECFTAGTIADLARHGSSDDRPVFIVGMPRTGTTLTEQILGSHPDVFGAGELPDLPRIINQLPIWLMEEAGGAMVPPYPHSLDRLHAQLIGRMAATYLATLDEKSAGETHVVDKNPFNFLNLGLIAILFPKARIIHCHRHPLDVGLSCYMEIFELRQDFTTDLGNIGHYYRQYERLMAHWRNALPMPMFDLAYEELIEAPEERARALVDFCGLSWDDACLAFHQREGKVLTPSKWQVRQPIYKSSKQRWRNYEQHLQPLKDALLIKQI